MDRDKMLAALKSCGYLDGQVCENCPLEFCSKECEELCTNAASEIEALQSELEQVNHKNKALENTNKRAYDDGFNDCKEADDALIAKLRRELEQVKVELSGVKGCSCHLCKHQLKGTCPHPEKSSFHGCRYFEVRGTEGN